MSRIGKKVIIIPDKTEVKISEGNIVTVTGPKGKLTKTLRSEIDIRIEENKIIVSPKVNTRMARALYGLSRTLIANMVEGVTKGFEKRLEIVGVGYKGQVQGRKLILQIGYSHPVEIDPPEGIEIIVDKGNKITVRGIDKELVGNIAATIRDVRKPEPYKGKGIKYENEYIRRKAGKAKK